MVFRCANDTLVTDMTSALAIPSAARNLIAADFIALSPFSMCPRRMYKPVAPKSDAPSAKLLSAPGPKACAARTSDR